MTTKQFEENDMNAELIIYTRDQAGLITYHGATGWDNLQQLLEHYNLAEAAPEEECLVGWPHGAVTWYGHFGVATA
jgi:hypothetical protein